MTWDLEDGSMGRQGCGPRSWRRRTGGDRREVVDGWASLLRFTSAETQGISDKTSQCNSLAPRTFIYSDVSTPSQQAAPAVPFPHPALVPTIRG